MTVIAITYKEVPFYFDVVTEVNMVPTETGMIQITGTIQNEERSMKIKVTDIGDFVDVIEELRAHIGVLSIQPSDYYTRSIH